MMPMPANRPMLPTGMMMARPNAGMPITSPFNNPYATLLGNPFSAYGSNPYSLHAANPYSLMPSTAYAGNSGMGGYGSGGYGGGGGGYGGGGGGYGGGGGGYGGGGSSSGMSSSGYGGSSQAYGSPSPYPGYGSYGSQPSTESHGHSGLQDFLGLPHEQGHLSWPLGLRVLPPASRATELRQQVESLVQLAAAQAAQGNVSSSTVELATDATQQLRELLKKAQGNVALAERTRSDARQFLNRLESALLALRR
jgi:hypothetical protein